MALKKRITKEDHSKLSDLLKGEYIENSDGSFRLDLDGDEDTGPLKRAKDRETQLRKEAEQRLAEAQATLDELNQGGSKNKEDVKLLEKAWTEKLTAAETAAAAKIQKLTSHVTTGLVDNVAQTLAHKLSPQHSKLLLPHIKARLQANFEGDEPATVILGADGKPSKLTVDELAAEFTANKDFSGIIQASKASGGGGASGQRQQVQTPAGGGDGQPPNLATLNPKQFAEQIKANKENPPQ